MGMEESHTEVSGGGSVRSVADLPSDWRRQMDEEMREALRELDAENNIDRDAGEFTIADSVGIWAVSASGTQKKVTKLVAAGKLTVRKAYDPEGKKLVNAYKATPSDTPASDTAAQS